MKVQKKNKEINVNLQLTVVDFDNNMGRGDLFMDENEIYVYSTHNQEIVIDMNGLWHNPKNVKKIINVIGGDY
jgi:hypothetical protein